MLSQIIGDAPRSCFAWVKSRHGRALLILLFLSIVINVSSPERVEAQDLEPSSKPEAADASFRRRDADGDGRLSVDELPPGRRRVFGQVDQDGDGFISVEEDRAFRARALAQGLRNRLPEGTQVLRDLAYVDQGHPRQVLDLYLPPGEKVRPVVIWIHGGAWQSGSKADCPAKFLLHSGFAVVSLNYRLSQHAAFPAQIQDCKTAIGWLRLHADEYRLDESHFGVWGSSAGGHLVALLGTSGGVTDFIPKEYPKGQSDRVQAVVDYYGPTDFSRMNQQAGSDGKIDHDAPNSPESKLIGGPIQEQREKTQRANPVAYVDSEDPPFFLVHGSRDRLVPLGQTQLLEAALRKSDVTVDLVVVENGGHGPFHQSSHHEAVKKFFQKHLRQSNGKP